VFFVERSLGSIIIPDALRQAHLRVEIHDDHFAQDAEDELWLTHAGQRGWVVLTKDERIRYRPNELRALIEAEVRTFIVIARNRPMTEVATIVVQALPAIAAFLAQHSPPFVAKITADSKVAMVVRKLQGPSANRG
jgi:predicted nuclease of predicted toxin-antitoxin system